MLTPAVMPVVVQPGEEVAFKVHYQPTDISTLDADGKLIPDTNRLRILSNAATPEVEIEMRGFGPAVECPTAVILFYGLSTTGSVVGPTTLHLVGDMSFAANGSLSMWEWSVEQPPGSASVFLPSANAPDPSFEVNVIGTYTFTLNVKDEAGVDACELAELTVHVVPDDGIHVELLWDTPADDDQTDEGTDAGADLDLHFVHPLATGSDLDGDGVPEGYCHDPFDCYSHNSSPDWGSFNPAVDDDPHLLRDDTDGAGPETIKLVEPEEGLTYRVGVKYWSDHDFGPSVATLRVYVDGQLAHETAGVELTEPAAWDAVSVSWPDGVVEPLLDAAGEPRIYPEGGPQEWPGQLVCF